MAADYYSPPEFNTTYAWQVTRLMVERDCGSPEVIRRISLMAAAFEYCAAEFEVWRNICTDVDGLRSGSHWTPGNIKWVRDRAEAQLGTPPPPEPPSAVQVLALKTLLGALVDDLGHEAVAVALDGAVKDRTP